MMFTNILVLIFIFSCSTEPTEGWNQDFENYADDVIENDVIQRMRREAGEDCDEDLKQPTNVTYDAIYPTATRIRWRHVEDAEWYTVERIEPESTCIRYEKQLNESLLNLRDLDADTSYTVSVMARSSNGCSEPKEIIFKTAAGSWKCSQSSQVPSEIISLEVPMFNISSTGAIVSWIPAPMAKSYQVLVVEAIGGRRKMNEEVREEWASINGLEPATQHLVRVTPKNGEHEGPTASLQFITRMDTPAEFKVANESSTFFQVTWDDLEYAALYTLVLKTFDENGDSYPVQRFNNTSDNFAYFHNLTPATRYQVSLQAFSPTSESSSLVTYIESYFTKLPMTSDVTLSNVTEKSVFVQWRPVEGAIQFRLRLMNSQQEVEKDLTLNETSCFLDDLKSASEYELTILALNDVTSSLTRTLTVYTRLDKIQHLNVDKEFVEDTSIVIRWEPIRGAEWYDVHVDPANSKINDSEVGQVRMVSNLTPGTRYRFTVRAMNHPTKDTVSLPSSVEQFTRLSRPLNMSIHEDDVRDRSMLVTWQPVPHAGSYLILVYDCSRAGQTSRVDRPSALPVEATNPPPASHTKIPKYWKHSFVKVKSMHLHCDQSSETVEEAIGRGYLNVPQCSILSFNTTVNFQQPDSFDFRLTGCSSGEDQLPSNVRGQGRTNRTEVLLSNMRPNSLYEIIVVSGIGEMQSNPSRIIRYTKLSTPSYFRIDPVTVQSSSLTLEWGGVDNVHYYQLDTYTTPRPNAKSEAKRNELVAFRSARIAATGTAMNRLHPSTKYTFNLTARNNNTWSFPVTCSVFTLLSTPTTLNIDPNKLTTNSVLIQWGKVADAKYYNISFTAIGNRMKRGIPHQQIVTKPSIELTNLTSNTQYHVTIVAENQYTRSKALKDDIFTELPQPKNFTVVNVTDTSMTLTWSDVEGREEFVFATATCPSKPVHYRMTSDRPSMVFGFLSPNQCYNIRMKAINPNTQSKMVEMTQHTKLPRPQQVALVGVNSEKIELRWRPVEGAAVYNLQITPLFNQSTFDQSPQHMDNDVIMVGGPTRRRRSERDERERRAKRSGDVSEEGLDELSFIEYKTFRSSRGSKKQATGEQGKVYSSSDNRFDVNVTYTYVTVSHLEPGLKYGIVLRAVNRNTDSLVVSKQTFTELKQPQSVEARDVTNSTIVFRWRPVTKASYYHVRIIPELRSSIFAYVRGGSGNTTNTEVEIVGLSPNTNYNLVILAGNVHVRSAENGVWQITKLSPVENLRVLNSTVTNDRFHLKWEEVTYAERYVITIRPPTLDGRGRIYVEGATETTIRGLDDGTRYVVTVSAENPRTGGMETELVQYTKLLTPRNVTIPRSLSTSHSFMIGWLPIPGADRYRVEVDNRTDANARVMFTDRTELLVDHLHPGYLYVARVIAQNTIHVTVSDPVQVSVFTKLETPQNLNVLDDDVTESSMIVTWDAVPMATGYLAYAGVESRDDDHHRVSLRWGRLEFPVPSPFARLHPLHPASYYLIEVKAINENTESDSMFLHRFTKLHRPKGLELKETFYMDTEADMEWNGVEGASYYILMVYRIVNETDDIDDSIDDLYDVSSDVSATNYSLELLNSTRIEGRHYHTVVGLIPETHYMVALVAYNVDTRSDQASITLLTKSSCSGDYHFFPKTHLAQALPSDVISNTSESRCMELCCGERRFSCRSVSLHLSMSNCLLFAEDRNTAPPLAISRDYDHFERKFWREVSGFQIRSITHNDVAVMNETVELTLTFVYLGKTGCVEWDFGDGGTARHSILGTNCSYLCLNVDNADDCDVIDTKPNENGNKIVVTHEYDMEDVFTVTVNVTDFTNYEVKKVKIAINERGCIYPAITIEEEGKNKISPKNLFRSHKLLLSATPSIVCLNFPGVDFTWGAVKYTDDLQTIEGSLRLEAKGSEVLIPPLTFALGLYRLSVGIEVLDDQHDLRANDAIFVNVLPSPLVARIKGGGMRTVGAGHDATWDSASESFDPDAMEDGGRDLTFAWFCRNHSDDKFRLFRTGSCVRDVSQVIFTSPGVFRLNTNLMELYVPYTFSVIVKKGKRESEFRQQVVVKEGDPPDFYIRCADNCKTKMNPTQALALQALCYNCNPKRNPAFKWRLYQVESPQVEGNDTSDHPDIPIDSDEEIFIEQNDWEMNTTTGGVSPILVIKKNVLIGGRRYVFRLNVTMDGLDGRVFSFVDFDFLTNLPPYGGVCTTSTAVGNCHSYTKFQNYRLSGITHKQSLSGKSLDQCQEYCCLTRDFVCLSLSYDSMTSNCWLFDHNKETSGEVLEYDAIVDYFERLFYRGGAVVDEIVFECKGWKDEGEMQSYPKPGERAPQTSLTYKFTTIPQGNETEGLLLYFGSVQKTPMVSMALGDPTNNYSVSVIARVCDQYGECALSNVIPLQIVPPDSNIGSTLTKMTSGNASKLGILSTTGNSKAAAQLVQSISSLINVDNDDDEIPSNFSFNQTTPLPDTTTGGPATTTRIAAPMHHNKSRNESAGIGRKERAELRSNVVNALSAATSSVTSLDNLQQMSSAMNAITRKPDQIDTTAQLQASETVLNIAGSLSSFSDESNKANVATAASNIVGSLGSVAQASMTDMTSLQAQLLQKSEIDFSTLDEEDLSPDEWEYYNRRRLRAEKKRVRRSAMGSRDVVGNAVAAMADTGSALLGKQLEGEPPVDVSSDKLEMKVEKASPSALANRSISTRTGSSIKLPDARDLLGDEANSSDPVDLQVTSFDDNPFGFGDDAAFIDSPVTMLKVGGAENGGASGGESKRGVGISVPSKFDPRRDMVTISRDVNATGLSISKFEVKSRHNAVLILIEPEDERAEFEVFLRLGSKPSEDEFDYRFDLPRKIWNVDDKEDLYKIFISENDVTNLGIFFIGIKDKLNITAPLAPSHGRVRRRRSVTSVNSTNYHLMIATPGCRRFDQETKSWTGDGCRVDERSRPEVTECTCTKLSATSIFSAEFFVPPNTINFATVFAKINIADNPAVFSTVVAFVGVYLLMLVWARRADKTDNKKWSLKLTTDNRNGEHHLYQVTVFTGHGRASGTNSKVFCVIFGESGKSRVRRLDISDEKDPFKRSSVVHFLLNEPKSLGPLTHIHIWHDNSGKGGQRSWFLDQVVVQDVSSGKRFFFICDQWLAVDQDDGKVNRVLPLASPENMTTFHRLFISTTAQKFTEDHLWISVFYRPTKSNFTRKQRLSCCMALLFMTMIANAMFFESGSSSAKTGTATFRVGPFVLSPLQIWTSLCSSLLVVPATAIIMTLFKRAKTKRQEEIDRRGKEELHKTVEELNMKHKNHRCAATLPAPSDLVGRNAVYHINADGTINAKPNVTGSVQDAQRPAAQWPHYCVYIAWFLTWTVVLVCGFFAILYSFEWGRDKAERWLSNMMLSFWQSVLIIQPIKQQAPQEQDTQEMLPHVEVVPGSYEQTKLNQSDYEVAEVIFLAMFVAAVLKKPEHQGLDSVDAKEITEVEKKMVDLCADNIESEMQQKEMETLRAPKPPNKRKLRIARRLRRKEREMSDIIWEIVGYFLYVMVLLFLCHANRDIKGQRISKQIKTTFVTSMYGLESVTSVEYFWRFVNSTLLPNLYPSRWYNGARKNWRERSFITDEQSYRVGPARMRQVRVQEHACPLVGAGETRQCQAAFQLYREEKKDFLPGWKYDPNVTSLSEDDVISDPSLVAWRHQNWIQLKGVPFIGHLGVYPGSGYSAELGVNFESGSLIVESLFRDAWIDEQTRAVFIEFTLYNPNVNLFTSVQLLTEFPPVGAAVTFTSILTFRLYQYLGSYGTLMVIAQAIFVLHLLHSTYSIIKRIIVLRRVFYTEFWNVLEFLVLLANWVVTSLYLLQVLMTNMTLDDFHENKRKYVNFQQVTMIDLVVGGILAILAFLGIIRFLKLLRFNRKVGMLTSVLRNSAKQWPGFFVLAAVFFVAFIHIGYLVFSPFLEDFKTVVASMETMFSLMMGRPLYKDLRDLYKIFGPLFYFIFCFTAAFIIINVLIAIINESYGITATSLSRKKNDYEIIDFMIRRFIKWSGVAFLQPPPKEKRKPETISPSKVPLPPLPYKLEGRPRSNLIELQKTMDKFAFDLESKYNKHLKLEELKDGFMAEMADVSSHNNAAHIGVLLGGHRRARELRPRSSSVEQHSEQIVTSRRVSKETNQEE